MIRVLEPMPPQPAREPDPLDELLAAAVDWHHAHDPFPAAGTVPADMRSGRVFAHHARTRAAAAQRLHDAVQAYEDAPERRTLAGWLADRGLATPGDWWALLLLLAGMFGYVAWLTWKAGR
jgi:hypothetical protein